MNRKLRVLHLKRSFLKRTETFIYTQITHLQQPQSVLLTREVCNLDQYPGIDIRAYCSEPPSYRKRWADTGYKTLRQMFAHEWRFYCKQVDELSPDLFHAHYAVDAAYFANLKHKYNKPLIVSCYGYDVSSFPQKYLGLGRHYLQRAFNATDLFLAMSEDMKQDLVSLGVPPTRILIHHPNGVDLREFGFYERRPEPGRNIRVLCIASFEEKKGLDYLVAAFAQVWKHTPNIELRLVGDGPLRPKLMAQIRSLGLEDSLMMPGIIKYSQLAEEYYAADLFCLPSVKTHSGDKEGIPTVLVEAQATGLPTVSTWHAGIPDVVVNGKTGFLVKERDVGALAERLIYLIDHPVSRTEFGQAGRNHVEQYFDAKKLARELEEIYERMLGS